MNIRALVWISVVTLSPLQQLVYAQSSLDRAHLLQVDFGISGTLHYNPPVMVSFCEEGCYPEKQIARPAINFGTTYYRKINPKGEVLVGLGYYEYRFLEKGFASPGDLSLVPYEAVIYNAYFSASAGYRYRLKDKRLGPFIENSLYCEMLLHEDSILKSGGFAIRTAAGFLTPITENVGLGLKAFFKSAITRYNNPPSGPAYLPYGYGVEIGLYIGL